MDTKDRLRLAVQQNKLNTVKLILGNYPKLLRNVDPATGWSNLHHATHCGHYEVCVYLINEGHEREVVSRTHKSETALHLAARGNHEKTLHFLAQHIAQAIDWRDDQWQTPLLAACMRGHHPCVQLLLDFGADMDKGDRRNTRPIHEACARGHVKVLRTLVDRGCDVRSKNLDGWTPLDFAMNMQVYAYFQTLVDPPRKMSLEGPSTPVEGSFDQAMRTHMDSQAHG